MNLEEKVDELRLEISEIKSALKGYNGGQGLIPTFEKHCEMDLEFRKDYYKFKRNILIGLAFLAGSGALSVSIWRFLF